MFFSTTSRRDCLRDVAKLSVRQQQLALINWHMSQAGQWEAGYECKLMAGSTVLSGVVPHVFIK